MGQRDGEERHCGKTQGPWKHRTGSQAPALPPTDSEEGWASWPLLWASVSPFPSNEKLRASEVSSHLRTLQEAWFGGNRSPGQDWLGL